MLSGVQIDTRFIVKAPFLDLGKIGAISAGRSFLPQKSPASMNEMLRRVGNNRSPADEHF